MIKERKQNFMKETYSPGFQKKPIRLFLNRTPIKQRYDNGMAHLISGISFNKNELYIMGNEEMMDKICPASMKGMFKKQICSLVFEYDHAGL